jgi:hypothetical protein
MSIEPPEVGQELALPGRLQTEQILRLITER